MMFCCHFCKHPEVVEKWFFFPGNVSCMLRSVGVLELSPSFSAIVICLSSIPFSIYVCVILMNGCVVRTVVTWPLYSRVSRVSGPVILLFVYARQLPIFLFFRRSFAVSILYVLTMDVAFGPEGEVPRQPSLRSDLPSVGLSFESACCVTDTRHRDASSKGLCLWQVRICVLDHTESR